MLLVFAFCVLIFNESSTLQTYSTPRYTPDDIISVASGYIDSAHEDELIFTTGVLYADGQLRDELFDIRVDTIRLHRRVQMYQWIEQFSSSDEPVYEKIWSESHIDSSKFLRSSLRSNPQKFPYQSRLWSVETLSVGAFLVSSDF